MPSRENRNCTGSGSRSDMLIGTDATLHSPLKRSAGSTTGMPPEPPEPPGDTPVPPLPPCATKPPVPPEPEGDSAASPHATTVAANAASITTRMDLPSGKTRDNSGGGWDREDPACD